jgi:hypothetical protein
MTHKELVASTAAQLLSSLIQANVNILRLEVRDGDKAVKELGSHFATLVSVVDTSLKKLE